MVPVRSHRANRAARREEDRHRDLGPEHRHADLDPIRVHPAVRTKGDGLKGLSVRRHGVLRFSPTIEVVEDELREIAARLLPVVLDGQH
jgi:hypothetical protein